MDKDDKNVMYDAYDEVASLLQGVAHEINNPITSIRTNVKNIEMMLDEFEPIIEEYADDHPEESIGNLSFEEALSRLRQSLNGIHSASARVSTVVENFKDFAGSSGGEMTEINLVDVVESSVSMTSYEFGGSDIVQLEVPNEPVMVNANQMQLEQVFVNLLTNASHALKDKYGDTVSEQGEVVVSMNQMNRDGEEWVNVIVSDNGPGVPEDLKDSIFAPYITTKEQGKGFGIGLSKALGTIQEHGGHLYLHDNSQPGAEFVVELPINATSPDG
ncbi:MAG: sensor histidine kinase [bacterium]